MESQSKLCVGITRRMPEGWIAISLKADFNSSFLGVQGFKLDPWNITQPVFKFGEVPAGLQVGRKVTTQTQLLATFGDHTGGL